MAEELPGYTGWYYTATLQQWYSQNSNLAVSSSQSPDTENDSVHFLPVFFHTGLLTEGRTIQQFLNILSFIIVHHSM